MMLNEKELKAVESYMNSIVASHKEWWLNVNRAKNKNSECLDKIQQELYQDFKDSVRFEVGRAYIKIIVNSHVHSFIVKKANDKFQYGDILKAAGWAAPAKNFARGNIFQEYKAFWSGV